MIRYFFLSDKQKEIIRTCKDKNKHEYHKWVNFNVTYPVLFFMITLILVIAFKQNDQETLNTFFNGTLTFVGINILLGTWGYLFKVKDLKDAELDEDRKNIRDKLSSMTFIMIPVGFILYVIQILLLPKMEHWLALLILGASILLSVILSAVAGFRMFIVSDDYFNKAYGIDDSIQQNVNNLQNSLVSLR